MDKLIDICIFIKQIWTRSTENDKENCRLFVVFAIAMMRYTIVHEIWWPHRLSANLKLTNAHAKRSPNSFGRWNKSLLLLLYVRNTHHRWCDTVPFWDFSLSLSLFLWLFLFSYSDLFAKQNTTLMSAIIVI